MCNISVACTVISHKTGQQAVVLDHHIFDDRNGWITRRSPPQPTVSLTARAHTKVYEELGYRLHTRTRQITIAMTADTGCQSVLVGIKIIHKLGFKKSDLIPVKTKMSAVNPNSRGCYPTTVRKVGVWQSNRDSTNMLCDRRDRRCILESGSLYNTGNYHERLPANRISHSATHVSQFSCSKPTRRGVRLLLPHTHQAATITNCPTIPSN